MLIVTADRCIKTLSQSYHLINCVAKNHTSATQNSWEFGFRQQPRCLCNRLITAIRAFKIKHWRQLNINNLCPEVAWDVDLTWRAQTLCLRDDTVQNLSNT